MIKEVVFRADGNSKIGLGHLFRCYALAKMLESDFEVSFVCKSVPESFVNTLENDGFYITKINNEGQFLQNIRSQNVIVLDGYQFDFSYQNYIKMVGCKLVCIDDIHDREFCADLIINHAPDITPNLYKTVPNTIFALGLDYVLLRPLFLARARVKSRHRKAIQTLFICFGGADKKDLTSIIVKIALEDSRFKKVIVVVGTEYLHIRKLERQLENDSRFQVYMGVDENQMCDLIESSDLAIVPASGILQEVLSIGPAVISGIYIENQRSIYENYKRLRAFEDAGHFEPLEVRRAIDRSFVEKDTKHPIDGLSGDRLLKLFKDL